MPLAALTKCIHNVHRQFLLKVHSFYQIDNDCTLSFGTKDLYLKSILAYWALIYKNYIVRSPAGDFTMADSFEVQTFF